MGKLLMIVGLGIILVGAWIQWGPPIPWIGRLPGDIVVKRQNVQFYFPIVSCLLISALLSAISFLLNRK